ncbi:hypothetical protein [Roseateles sp.]|uniref:hypothetical protein n=1 Tax=Roseateles sp. TaxID=1971397 RepID=UPI00393E311E
MSCAGSVQALGAAAALLLLLLAAINGTNLRAELLRRCAGDRAAPQRGAQRRDLLLLWAPRRSARAAGVSSARRWCCWSWWLAPWLAQWLGVWLPELPLLALARRHSRPERGIQRAARAPPAPLALRQAPARALQARTAGEGPWGRRLRQGLPSLQLLGALLLVA